MSAAALAPVLLGALDLKALPRAGWLRVGIAGPESVAAHSWGIALLVLAVPAPELDQARMLAFACVHDLAEARAGDITPHDGVPPAEKHAREARAAAELLGPAPALHALWQEYEAQACPESRFVRQLDRLDMALQALRYAADGADTAEFLRSARRVIVDPRLLEILDAAAATCDGRRAP